MSVIKTAKKQPYRHSEYFAALDGFRGLLALFVAVYHTIWFSHMNASPFLENGAVIIDLFFAFSGFLMFRLYEDKLVDGASAKNYLKRRFARLYPLHLFMLAIFIIFAAARLLAHKAGFAEHEVGEILPFTAGAQDGWGSLLSHLTLTHAIGVNDSLTFNPPSWTISVEFFTYFIFVAMMLWAKPKVWLHYSFMAVCIGLIYAGLSRVKPDMNITYDYAFFRCIAGFFIGVIAAKTFGTLKPYAQAVSDKAGLFSVLEILTLLGSVIFVIYCGGKAQFFVGPVVLLFVVVFAMDGGIVSRFMSLPVFKYLAKISYSVYMIHVIISIGFSMVASRFLGGIVHPWNDGAGVGTANGLGGDLLMIPYLTVVIICSHFTYKYVERLGGKAIMRFKMPKSAKSERNAATPQ